MGIFSTIKKLVRPNNVTEAIKKDFQPTSMEAHVKKIKNGTKKTNHLEILRVLTTGVSKTYGEIHDESTIKEAANVSKRMSELVNYGFVKVTSRRICKVRLTNCMAYYITQKGFEYYAKNTK